MINAILIFLFALIIIILIGLVVVVFRSGPHRE